MKPTEALVLFFTCLCYLRIYAQNDECPNPLPGIASLRMSVDVTKLDLRSDHFQSRFFIDLTCAEGKKWTDPYNSSRVFDLPDQVEEVITLLEQEETINLWLRFNETKSYLAKCVGLREEGISRGMFSESEALINTAKATKYATDVEAVKTVNVYQIKMKPDVYIAPSFWKDLKKNENDMPTFVSKYGTHYLSSGIFGGHFGLVLNVDKELWGQLSEEYIKDNIWRSFAKQMNQSHEEINPLFSAHTEVSGRFSFGGKGHSMQWTFPEFYKSWEDSFKVDPYLIKATIKPLSDLLSEGPAKDDYIKATVDNMRRSYLRELEMILKYLPETRETKELAVSVEYLLKQTSPDADQTDHVGNRIQLQRKLAEDEEQRADEAEEDTMVTKEHKEFKEIAERDGREIKAENGGKLSSPVQSLIIVPLIFQLFVRLFHN